MSSQLRNRLRDQAYRLTSSYMPRFHLALQSFRRPQAGVDPSVRYPSYKSFDEFVDVERLRSLDGYVAERVRHHLEAGRSAPFYTGVLKLNVLQPSAPGSRQIELTRSDSDVYQDLNKPELWTPTAAAEEFSELMDFIRTLPFKETARIMILCDPRGRRVTPHRDHAQTQLCHEFVWFRTNLNKPFFLQDWTTGRREYVRSHSAWFDTVNQYHGADPCPGLAFSIRVDGVFDDAFRERIPTPPLNAASTASYWASRERAAAGAG